MSTGLDSATPEVCLKELCLVSSNQEIRRQHLELAPFVVDEEMPWSGKNRDLKWRWWLDIEGVEGFDVIY